MFCLVFDEDTDATTINKYPPLYKTLQKGRSLNFKTFMIWVWKSIYQGSVLILFAIVFFNESLTNIVTITFSALIAIELLNVYSEVSLLSNFSKVNKLNWKMIISSAMTFVVYILAIVLLKEYFDTSYLTPQFFVKLLALVAITWLPLHIAKLIFEKCDPPEYKKLMQK